MSQPMNTTCNLIIDLRSYWHIGSGRGQGVHLDALTRRDPHGLPLLPGRSVRGLLRDAVCHAQALGWYGDQPSLHESLFGRRVADGEHEILPGCLRVSDARLPPALSDWLAHKDQAALREGLFAQLFSTAIDDASGTALRSSLRGIEVCIPLELQARVELLPGAQGVPDAWQQQLALALPLIHGIGANRSRGMGRAVLRMEGQE